MAFDGITTAALCREFDETLTGGRIAKIIQPESDELIFTIKNNSRQHRLLLSASASLPLAYLTDSGKQAPMQAPNFCMLLRKHLNGGKILSITQPGLERILQFRIEHRNELGDLCEKILILELMGKHSNLIFTDDRGVIIDSIKRVSSNISSVREVLPGRSYFIPETQHKKDPLTISKEVFCSLLDESTESLAKTIYRRLTGLSPLASDELLARAGLSGEVIASSLSALEKDHLWHVFSALMHDVRTGAFFPVLYRKENAPYEFAPLHLRLYPETDAEPFSSMSSLVCFYYADRELRTRIRQKSTDLRKVVTTAQERTARKLSLQEKQMHDTEKKDRCRLYGELLHTYGYQAEEGAAFLDAENYYTGEPVRIPLDPQLSASENAKKYFDRYGKLKRTAEALTIQLEDTKSDLAHLESIQTALELASDEADLQQIRDELADYGYLRHKYGQKSRKKNHFSSHPLHYISSDGFDLYVGKNNYQNEEVSFHLASGGDWWFHAKGMPGSHVIVKTGGKEMTDRAFEEAGSLAAYYSKGRLAPKVEIDYTLKKNLRKPGGARPGFVVYYTNYSLMAVPDIHGLQLVPYDK